MKKSRLLAIAITKTKKQDFSKFIPNTSFTEICQTGRSGQGLIYEGLKIF